MEGVKGKLSKATALAIMGKIEERRAVTELRKCRFSQGQHVKIIKQWWRDTQQSIPLAAGDKLWWADQGSDQIGTCDKKDGGSWKVMRNNTSPMMHMRIYDESAQKCKKACYIVVISINCK